MEHIHKKSSQKGIDSAKKDSASASREELRNSTATEMTKGYSSFLPIILNNHLEDHFA